MLKELDLEKLKELLKICHTNGVHVIKVNGLEIALSPVDPNTPKSTTPQSDPLADLTSALSGMSEEDIALWSTR